MTHQNICTPKRSIHFGGEHFGTCSKSYCGESNYAIFAWLVKVDITLAFKVMSLRPNSWHLFGVRWRESFYFAVRLTLRCKNRPKIFDTLSKALYWILTHNHNLPFLVHLLDDFLSIHPPPPPLPLPLASPL